MCGSAHRLTLEPLGYAFDAASIYRALYSTRTDAADSDSFLTHIFACAFAVGIEEAYLTGRNVDDAVGLDRAALKAITTSWLPAAAFIAFDAEPLATVRDEEEEQLFELLNRFRVDDAAQTQWIISILTRRAMAPRHLWQDLGLHNRGELSALIERFFPRLAAENVANMKWKKFFYRKICELEGFSLCAAPTCGECADFDSCFGEEKGESALVRIAHS